ncbi:cordon-bleu protein-like 1 isoform X2 [Chelonus insularis]|nr:cordon-bleu protein-like 1 isoform X2 [Chelonus insularis]
MGLTVTEDTPADMLAGSMELLVQLPRDHHNHTQRVTVERSTAMMDLLVQIATAHKLAASSYTLQAVGERGLVLPHQPNTPIGALDALEVKLLPKQGTLIPRKTKQPSQPFETTFRLQVHLPRNQLYVSRVSPKTNLGDILDQVCHEKNLNKDKYELRHPGNHKEVLDLSLSLQDYQLQEVTLYAKQGQNLGSALSSQDIIALQRQEERRRQQAKQGVFGFIFRKSKESSLSTESYGDRSVSPARSDETGRSVSPLAPPTRPQRKRRPAPNPPVRQTTEPPQKNNDVVKDESKEKLVISHSRNSSDSSGYHEASVLSDNPDSAGRMPETLPRRSRLPGKFESRKLAQTSQASKSLCNLAMSCGGLSHANSNTSLSSAGIRKKRAAPQPPVSRPLSAAISTQALERIVDSEESLTSDMGVSKPPSDIGGSSETEINSKANSDIAVDVHASTVSSESFHCITNKEDSNNKCNKIGNFNYEHSIVENMLPSDKSSQNLNKQSQNEKLSESSEETRQVDHARIAPRAGTHAPTPKPRSNSKGCPVVPPRAASTTLSKKPISESVYEQEKNLTVINPGDKTEQINIVGEDLRNNANYKQKQDELNEANYNYNNNDDEINHSEVERSKNKDLIQNNEASEVVMWQEGKTEFSNKEMVNTKTNSNIQINHHDFTDASDLSPISEVNMSNPKAEIEIKNVQDALSEDNISSEEQFTTSPLITSGINLGLQIDLTHSTEEGELHSQGTGKAGNNRNQTETDHLLQKVSSTLATVLPTYEQNSWDANPSESRDLENINPVNLKNSTPHREETRFNDIPNSTLNSQQDTSDYVSANGEDLSGTDWEYQLPDPPSAFRDTINSDKDVCDTIMLHSVDAFKEPQVELEEKNCKTPTKEDNKSEKQKIECILEENSINKDNKISNTESLKTTSNPKQVQEKTDVELKKNIISELEAKIENGSLNQPSKNLELENRKTLIQTSTPRIAPVENTLPNFTITTYSRQKSLNIYDSPEKSALHLPDYSQDRIVKTFATLSRNVSSLSNNKGNYSSPSKINSPNDFINDNRKITRTQSIQNINSKGTADNDLRTKENNSSEEINHDNEVDNKNKSNAVHRSKSYIVLTNNLKYRENKPTSDVTDHEKMMKKSTSVTNLNQSNALVNETSQILQNGQKNLNISSQEKELQSVQVLKSILPQLKNTQLSEENTSNVFGNKTKIGEKILEKSNTQVHLNGGEEKNVISSKKKIEIEDTKRHRYTGPPSVSLGSWNERPCAHVQIKMDQDYKFGVKDNTSGAKTVVSLNSSSNNVDIMNFKDNYVKNLPKNRTSTVQNDNIPISNEIMPMIKRVTDNEVAKKVINTSISNKELGFNNLGFAKLRSASKDEDKPVVTNMELKKCYIDKPEFNDDDAKIDTRPVNFQELTQAFGQINLRTKSKYKNSQNRHSDYLDSRLNHDITDKNMAKTTGCKNSSESKNPIVKRYTSVIDIDNQHLTNGMKKNNTEKIPINSFNNYIPEMNRHSSTTTTVINKDFQIYSYKDTPKNANLSAKNNENKEIKLLVNNKINSHIPTPPSMPIITGVTLKSNNVRPKSMPVCNDPRDQLLESIRSFGRDKLRNVKIVS